MKQEKVWYFLQQFFTPGLLILVGLVLIFSPDTVSAMVAVVLGWALAAIGAILLLSLLAFREEMLPRIFYGVISLALGILLISDPLILARNIGRLAGILLAVRGIGDICESHRQKQELLLPILTTAIGGILILLPMTTSRVVIGLFGGVLLCLGAAILVARIRMYRTHRPHLEDGGNTIDVDAL